MADYTGAFVAKWLDLYISPLMLQTQAQSPCKKSTSQQSAKGRGFSLGTLCPPTMKVNRVGSKIWAYSNWFMLL